jgi:hypothetical protein
MGRRPAAKEDEPSPAFMERRVSSAEQRYLRAGGGQTLARAYVWSWATPFSTDLMSTLRPVSLAASWAFLP